MPKSSTLANRHFGAEEQIADPEGSVVDTIRECYRRADKRHGAEPR